MKSNLFKYIFIVFVICILVFSFYKIKNDEKKGNQTQSEVNEQEKIKVKEINLGIAEFDTLNPILSTNKNVQDIDLTTEYKAQPCLAKEWAKQTEKSYIIKLREDVKWSDGSKFTSEDVRFTIDKLKEIQSIYTNNVQDVIGVDIIDEFTIKINLSKEVAFFEYNLIFPIVSKNNYTNETVPIGTGKYKINSITESNIILEQNSNWSNRTHIQLSLEKIRINKYGSLGEMYNAFKIGNIDLVSSSNENLQEYIGKIGYSGKQLEGREHIFLALNTQNKLLSQLSVRKAILHSIDKENIISSIFNNKYYISNFPLEYGTWIYQGQNSSIGYNPEQGKQILSDNKWIYKNKYWQKYENYKTQKLVLNILVKGNDNTKVAVAENIKAQLENQGIGVNIINASDNQYINSLNTRNYDIALCSIYMSPSPNMDTFFGENNIAGYNNAEANEIMKEVKNTTDENIQKKDYQKLSEIYKNDVPYISLYTKKYIVAYNSSLAGEITPNWFNSFYKIETWSK
ncbi:MAG: ABC transporter substrate-binding protein [Clostridia bacterium]